MLQLSVHLGFDLGRVVGEVIWRIGHRPCLPSGLFGSHALSDKKAAQDGPGGWLRPNATAKGSKQYQTLDPPGVAGHKFLSNRASHRETEEMRLCQTDAIQQACDIRRLLGEVVAVLGLAAPPGAAIAECNDPAARRQSIDERARLGRATLAIAGDQAKRGAIANDIVVKG